VSDSAAPWFERCPELLEWELERFGQWGIEARIDEGRRARGQMALHCEASLRGDAVAIEVRYPSEYPELPPLIFGAPGLLERHQHRFGGNFCLLERPLDDWPAGEWGAADLLGERLTALFRDTEAGPEAVRAGEAPMPEPVSTYFMTPSDLTVLVGEEVKPTGADGGKLSVRRLSKHMFVVVGNGESRLEEPLAETLGAGDEISVPWVRLAEAPPAGRDGEGASVARWLSSEHPGLLARDLPHKLAASKRLPGPPPLELCCLVFPEEGPGVGETRDGYLFLMVERGAQGKRETLLRAQLLSAAEHGRRRPELAGLAEKRALVIGAGTLGGDIAVELAKAGVGEIEPLDCDTFEVGNTVRHRLGLESVGMPKALAVAAAARRANPFCRAEPTEVRLGMVEWSEQSPLAQLADSVAAADIVIEASGSHQIAKLVSRVCGEEGKPMISTWLNEGFYGAEVVRIRPGQTMCWRCFATAQLAGEALVAEAGPPSQVSAQGCAHPTTAGAGFDALETAAVATRLAVQTLEPDGGYPDCEWDHAVLNFRRQPGDVEHPRIATEQLPVREDCEECKAPAGSGAALSKSS
jgi:molybdopterin/thiamine biosynthesis adenylyltransferase